MAKDGPIEQTWRIRPVLLRGAVGRFSDLPRVEPPAAGDVTVRWLPCQRRQRCPAAERVPGAQRLLWSSHPLRARALADSLAGEFARPGRAACCDVEPRGTHKRRRVRRAARRRASRPAAQTACYAEIVISRRHLLAAVPACLLPARANGEMDPSWRPQGLDVREVRVDGCVSRRPGARALRDARSAPRLLFDDPTRRDRWKSARAPCAR